MFMPQIFILTLVVGILEDGGYLARAAGSLPQTVAPVWPYGQRVFVMLNVACAIPGIYTARTVDSPRKRWLTYLAMPVDALLCSTAGLQPVNRRLYSRQQPARWSGWLAGAGHVCHLPVWHCGRPVSHRWSRTSQVRATCPLCWKCRLPYSSGLLRNAGLASKHFVTKAGKIIFTVTVVIWMLGYFPNQGAATGDSWLGYMGRWIGPLFSPFGLDWKYGVAILTSFLAREVFVGTLGTLFGIEGGEENVISLAEHIQNGGGLPVGADTLLVFSLSPFSVYPLWQCCARRPAPGVCQCRCLSATAFLPMWPPG